MAYVWYVVFSMMIGMQCCVMTGHEEIQSNAGDMMEVIQQRAYLIRRLAAPVQTLFASYKKLKSENSFDGFCISADEIDSFCDPMVRCCIQKICSVKSIEPFYKVWESFLSYKYINREFFTQEALVVLMMLYRELLTKNNNRGAVHQLLLRVENCLQQYYQGKSYANAIISNGVATLYEYKKMATQYQHELSHLLVQHHITADLYYDEVQAQDIQGGLSAVIEVFESSAIIPNLAINNNIRFYYIQRVLRSIFILSRYSYTIQPFNDVCNAFKHPLIKECAAQIEETNNLKSLFKLWKCLASYNHIEDELLLQDFICLVICVFGHLEIQGKNGIKVPFFKTARVTRKELTLEQILHAYQDALTPLADLMDLLDEVVDQFDVFSREYELDNQSLSWFDWFAQYWWSVPIMFNKFMLILVKHASSIGSVVRLV
ncbi:MAG TPA: hypothetical protein VGT41_06960 [Candidatus Babeliales bacterium]|nr:hypothetical protein [Candidatus Babeliales bacterium]